MAIAQKLRPYQVEIGKAVLNSVLNRRGLTFTVEIARQGGKNEFSAQLQVLLLTLFMGRGGNMVKTAPTFVPQVLISMARLKERLNDAGFSGLWQPESGHIVRLGKARQIFLSAEPNANIVGTTAHILMEVDETQDVGNEKYYKEFRPMGASTNVTAVLYGTPCGDESLLEEVKDANLELERRDGIKRHFRFPWEVVAHYNPLYRRYVEVERERLGESHPLFRTQYLLLPHPGRSGLFSSRQRAQLQGNHQRRNSLTPGRLYVAGVDVGGGMENSEAGSLLNGKQRHDSTVMTIGELDFSTCDDIHRDPTVRVVEHCCWTGVPHHDLYPRLVDILKNVWDCRRVVVDATGLGEGVASVLERALGKSKVEAFRFTAPSKSKLGYQLIAAVNSGRLKMYSSDDSPEYQEFWHQMERARSQYRPNQTINFFVDPAQGHDDFLSSLALLVEAAKYTPRMAKGLERTDEVPTLTGVV